MWAHLFSFASTAYNDEEIAGSVWILLGWNEARWSFGLIENALIWRSWLVVGFSDDSLNVGGMMWNTPLGIHSQVILSAWVPSWIREMAICRCDSTNLTRNAFSFARFASREATLLVFCIERSEFHFIPNLLRPFFAYVTTVFEHSAPTPTNSPHWNAVHLLFFFIH